MRRFETRSDETGSGVRRDSLINPLTSMGSSGDKTQTARPNVFVQPLDDEELRSLFNNNGIARRIVDILPEYATREGWNVVGANPGTEKRLRLRANVQEAMTMAQLYGGSALLLVTTDDIPPRFRKNPEDWLTQPLDLDRVVSLDALQVFDTFEAHPLHEIKNPANPNYRGPEYWSIGSHGFYATVHWTRVIQFDGRLRIPSERWSRASFGGFGIFNRQQNISYLQAVYDEIRHLAETIRSGAVLSQEMQKSVYQIDGLDAIRAGDEAEDLVAKLAAAQRASSVLGATVIGKEDDFHHVAGTSTGFADLSDAQMAMLSFVTGIPRMIWFGEQPAGLSTDGDASWKGFRQRVSQFQEKNRGPIERIYEVMGAAQDSKSTIDPGEVELTFNPLDEPTNLEQAQARLANVQADATEVAAGVLSPEEVRKRYETDDGYLFELPQLEPIDAEEAAMRVALKTQAAAPPMMPEAQSNGNRPPRSGEGNDR